MLLRNFSYIDWTNSKYKRTPNLCGETECSVQVDVDDVVGKDPVVPEEQKKMENALEMEEVDRVELVGPNEQPKNPKNIEIVVEQDEQIDDGKESEEQQGNEVVDKWWMRTLRQMIPKKRDQSITSTTSQTEVTLNGDGSAYIDVWWLIDDGGMLKQFVYTFSLHHDPSSFYGLFRLKG